MTDATPAAQLRQAADTLRAVGAYQRGELRSLPDHVTDVQWDRTRVIHPAVSAALADWLEEEARQEAYTLAEFGHRSASPNALAVARALLGGVSR